MFTADCAGSADKRGISVRSALSAVTLNENLASNGPALLQAIELDAEIVVAQENVARGGVNRGAAA